MKYVFIMCTALLMATVTPISDAQTNPNKNTISGQIVAACEGRSTSCIENETLCRAGDQAACAARKKEEKAFKQNKKKK